jgi:hypothetical protein
MFGIQHVAIFVGLLPVVIGIAGTLWWEMRRDQRRRRLLHCVESVLRNAETRRVDRRDLKRAA